MRKRKPFRDAKVHVLDSMCSTCIFRPGNLMDLHHGRVKQMVAEADRKETAIICHSTLDGEQAVCHGYFKLRSSATLRLAQALDRIQFVKEPEHDN